MKIIKQEDNVEESFTEGILIEGIKKYLKKVHYPSSVILKELNNEEHELDNSLIRYKDILDKATNAAITTDDKNRRLKKIQISKISLIQQSLE